MLFLFLFVAFGQYDPFIGSNCDCARFCNYECSINGTKAPINGTFYRMSMKGVLDLRDKDTGDIPGDTSFVLSRKNTAYECRKDPKSFMCKDVAQFSGDDANSTDIVLEMQVEVDGQWGPYLPCNPVNVSDPYGAWNCTTDFMHHNPPDYPHVCVANNYSSAYEGYAIMGIPDFRLNGISLSDCCSEAAKHSTPSKSVWAYNYNMKTQTCSLFTRYQRHFKPSNDTITSHISTPDNACNCDRVYKSVGRELREKSSHHLAGGYWQSFPHKGECAKGGHVGDGSNCTYRVLGISKAIKASCLYELFDTTMESYNPTCFSKCGPKPYNTTSDCYLECFDITSRESTEKQLTEPWYRAFGGACPIIPVKDDIVSY